MRDFDVAGLIKVVVGVLTPAAVFYAIGYVITQAYVTSTGLQASFWFTESFYREAGARFLLDIVIAIALVPHLFIPLSALFMVLFPGDFETWPRSRSSGSLGRLRFASDPVLRRALFLLLVLLAVASIVSVLRNCAADSCASIIELPGWFFTSSWLLKGAQDRWLRQQPFLYPMAIFLAVAIPTVVTLGAWAYRAIWAKSETGPAQTASSRSKIDGATSRATHPVAAFFIAATFVILMAYVPIGYGAYFYDFVVVSLVDKDKCAVGSESSAQTPGHDGDRPAPAQEKLVVVDCYLLGRFETRYILIGREATTDPSIQATGEETDQRIYIKQVEKLEPFAIESRHPIPLRSLTTPDPPA